MLLGLVGGRCERCGTVQFPRSNICVEPTCRARKSQAPQSMADFHGRILSWSADYLTYSVDPPSHFATVEFYEGGRMIADLTDVEVGEVEVGMPVRMAFRIKDQDALRGFTRYFWKAVPERTDGPPAEGQV
jgi:uncharacterized OB-fold protein